jgi:hypothetical protein
MGLRSLTIGRDVVAIRPPVNSNKEKEPLPAALLERQPNGKYRAVKHPNWGTQQPSKPAFRGQVYILINGNSFSTTAEFLSHVHFRKRATFIGEESGGGYYGNSSGFMPRLVLPNTKAMVSVPLMTYYLSVGDYQPKAAAHGITPIIRSTTRSRNCLRRKIRNLPWPLS